MTRRKRHRTSAGKSKFVIDVRRDDDIGKRKLVGSFGPTRRNSSGQVRGGVWQLERASSSKGSKRRHGHDTAAALKRACAKMGIRVTTTILEDESVLVVGVGVTAPRSSAKRANSKRRRH